MKAKCLTSTCRFATAALLTLSGVLGVRASDYPTTINGLTPPPVAYYRLSETTPVPAASTFINLGSLGSSENALVRYPAALAAEDPCVAAVAGVVGTAVAFTNPAAGANLDFASIMDAPYNVAWNPNGPFSVECWAKPNGHATDLIGLVCSLNSAQSRSGWVLYQNTAGAAPGNGTPSWEFRTGGLNSYAGTIDTGPNTVVAGSWSHLVAVFDGLNMSLYLNGVLAAGPTPATSGSGYNPNIAQPLRIGGTTFPNRGFDGTLDEVAFYGSALSASTIAAHYDAAKPVGATNNTPAGYHAQILTSSPLGYWPLDDATYTVPAQSTLPTAANSGSLGAPVKGTNQPGMTAGASGPPFAGFPGGNVGGSFNGVVGNINVGNPAGLNFDGAITMIAWVKPSLAASGVVQDILVHGYRANPNQEVFMRINGTDYGVGANTQNPNVLTPTEGANTTGGRAALDAAGGAWVFLAASFDGSTWRLYRYDQLVGSGAGTLGSLFMDPDPANDPAYWSIGGRSDFTEDFYDTAMDRPFFGSLDEVAIFTNALSTAQIQSIFYSAQMSPIFISVPTAPPGTLYEGPSYSFTVEAAGNPTLLYQWQKNGTNLSGQTTTSLSLNNVTTNDSGTYAIIVTNNYGSITSLFSMTILAGPPLFTSQPVSITRFVGATASFSSAAVGSPAITYQWYYNTNTAIGSATTTTYSKANVQLADAGKYNLRAFNPYNPVTGTNSSFATLAVNAVPGFPYPAAIIADNPLAFYRLDESSGTVAHDNWGGHDGTYNGGVVLNQTGYLSLDTDKAAGFGASGRYVGGITGLDFSGTGVPFTLEAWVNGPANQPGNDTGIGAVIIGKGRGGNGAGGANGLQYVLDVSGGKFRFHVEAASGTPSTGDAISDLGPNGTWQHVVGTLDAGGNMTIYVNGQIRGNGTAPPNGLLTSALKTTIGSAQGGVTPNINAYFTGTLDEVAVYGAALTPIQVNAHYCAQFGSGQRPLLLIGPTPTTNWISWPLTLSAVVAGSCDLIYQWYHGSTPLTDGGTIVGATSNILTITSAALSDRGTYYVSNYNSVGSSNSAPVYVDVLATPTVPIPLKDLVMHLQFNNSLTDSTGRGNDGTGKHTSGPTGGTTTTVNPSPANGGLFEYVTGGTLPNATTFGLKGLHYSSDCGLTPHQPSSVTSYGTNDYYVSLGTRPDLKFSSNVNFSVSYWARLPINYDLGDLPFFCDATNSTGGKGFTFAPSYGSNGVFAAGTEANSGAWAWSVNATRIEGPWYSLNDANWHNLVHSYDRAGNGVTYLDGVQVDSRSVAASGDMTQSAPASIGQDPTGAYGENGSADIADLGVWRRALTELQARGIYVAGTNGISFVDITPTITQGPGAGQVTITWQAGTLQQSGTANGTYSDTVFTSPYTFTPSGQSYYRVKQ